MTLTESDHRLDALVHDARRAGDEAREHVAAYVEELCKVALPPERPIVVIAREIGNAHERREISTAAAALVLQTVRAALTETTP